MKKLIYTILAFIFTASVASVCAEAATRSKKNEIARNLDIFNSLFKELQTFYVDSINSEKAINTAITAMLAELDPYTEYMPEEVQGRFKEMTTGEYGGIGSYIMERDGNVYISGPEKGSPAQLAGLRPGDLIMEIDTTVVLGMDREEVSSRLKGQPGTEVKVKVKRPYVEDSILTFDITRKKIWMPSVPYYGLVADGIGYIGLTQFTEKSPEEIRDAFLALKRDHQIESLILDLRDNPGGVMESAIKIVGYFVPKGTEVLRTRGKGILNEKVFKTTAAPIDSDIPLVVLIDGGSASASEITAGALQDLDRAVVVGNRSFGKGLVQTSRSIPYDGLLKVTVARYYIPSGRLVQAIDYSHRNPDGSVSRIPDSLTNVFHTQAGREVRDGGGITPDLTVEYPEVSRITYNIVKDNWSFDFANRYYATHPEAPAEMAFVMTDSVYEEFKAFIDPEKFQYDKVCESIVEHLREAAKIEGYMNDSLSAQLDLLESMMRHPLARDLDTNRASIEPYLAREIAARYYFTPGQIATQLISDPGVDSAKAILSDPQRYRQILSAPKSTQK